MRAQALLVFVEVPEDEVDGFRTFYLAFSKRLFISSECLAP